MASNFYTKLSSAVSFGFKKMEGYRKTRRMIVAQYAGRLYGGDQKRDDSDYKAAPLNLLYVAMTTYVANLAYNDPKFRVSTPVLPYRMYAGTLGLMLDHLTKEVHLRNTLRMSIVDALCGCGIIKTGIAPAGMGIVESHGGMLDIGQPYADRVDLDDYVCDPLARSKQEMAWEGNRFRISKQQLLEEGLIPPGRVEQLTSRYDQAEGYKKDVASVGDSKSIAQRANEINDYVDLVEVYLPRENLIVTLPWEPGEGGGSKPLVEAEFQGPEGGPFHLLGFAFVPDNPIPIASASIWYDMHMMANEIARKIKRQAARAKRVLAYEGRGYEDAQTIENAEDDETVRVDHIDAMKEFERGGVTDDSYKFMGWCRQQFSEIAGNIDLLSGLGSQESTATQAEMVQGNSTIRIDDAKNLVYHFAAEAGRDLAFFCHTDPLIDKKLVKRVGGVDIQVRYTPEMREGDFLDYMFTVYPESMARKDPNVTVRRAMDFASTVIPAFAQAFQILGPGFKIDNALAWVARETGFEEADEFIDSPALMQWMMMRQQMAPPDGGLAPQGQPPMMGQAPGVSQPNPGQMGPTGGMDPMQERHMMQQQAAAELQRI